MRVKLRVRVGVLDWTLGLFDFFQFTLYWDVIEDFCRQPLSLRSWQRCRKRYWKIADGLTVLRCLMLLRLVSQYLALIQKTSLCFSVLQVAPKYCYSIEVLEISWHGDNIGDRRVRVTKQWSFRKQFFVFLHHPFVSFCYYLTTVC